MQNAFPIRNEVNMKILKPFILCLFLFLSFHLAAEEIVSLQEGYEENYEAPTPYHNKYSLKVSPLALLVGMYSFGAEMKVIDNITVGVGAHIWDIQKFSESSGTMSLSTTKFETKGFNFDVTYYLNKETLKGFYVRASGNYTNIELTMDRYFSIDLAGANLSIGTRLQGKTYGVDLGAGLGRKTIISSNLFDDDKKNEEANDEIDGYVEDLALSITADFVVNF